jgi:hypothetical protein
MWSVGGKPKGVVRQPYEHRHLATIGKRTYMQAERVVELSFSSGNKPKAGSGYLITARHVLTARHVVSPDSKGAICTVRPLLAPGSAALPLVQQRQGLALPGHAAWLSVDADLAIIELDCAPIAELAQERICFGKVPLNDLTPRIFHCTGFPIASGTGSRTV